MVLIYCRGHGPFRLIQFREFVDAIMRFHLILIQVTFALKSEKNAVFGYCTGRLKGQNQRFLKKKKIKLSGPAVAAE